MTIFAILELTLIFFSVIAIALAIFWKTYFKEKAKNLATKQDIEIITRLTESVKSELDLRNEEKMGWQVISRQAILDYHKYLSGWFYGAYKVDITNKPEIIEAKLDKIKSRFNEADMHFRLIIADPKIIVRVSDFTIKIIDFHTFLLQSSSKFQNTKGIGNKWDIFESVQNYKVTEFAPLMKELVGITYELRDLIGSEKTRIPMS